MHKIFLLLLLISIALAKQDAKAKSTYGEPTDGGDGGDGDNSQTDPIIPGTDTLPNGYYYYDELVTRLNEYREKYANMYKDIEIDLVSKASSLAELKRLLNNIDSFSQHVDFETTYKSTYNQPPQFCEFICKLHQQYTSNAERCIELWDKKTELKEHMRLEYATGGSTCANYGNGVLCVMHVREQTATTIIETVR